MLAPRGKILDRDGRVIVDNKASYSLLLNRDEIKWEHLPAIANALQLDYGELSVMIRRSVARPTDHRQRSVNAGRDRLDRIASGP